MHQYNFNDFSEYLRARIDSRCQICGNTNWNIETKVFELREFSSGDLALGGPIIPLIPMTCTNCGNTALINAIHAGLVKNNNFNEK